MSKRKKELVADALRRQGIDPNTVKSNNAELNAICGKRFEGDMSEEKKPDTWAIALGPLSTSVVMAVSEYSPECAWTNAEKVSGVTEKILRQSGYYVRPIKITFLDQD